MDSRLRSPVGPLAVLIIALLLRSAYAVATQPADLIWQLRDIDAYRPTGNPSLGHQNITWCCIKAVAESLEVVDGQLQVLANHSDWIILSNGNASTLIDQGGGGSQFPCTAVYAQGDDEGAAVVQVPYTWRLEYCPGWQLSDRTNLNAWLQPLSGFLLPAVIFCLSIPRRRKLRIPGGFFANDIDHTSSYPTAVINAIQAGAMVLADTIIWLSLCFAFAGPMILSGLYEALLDSRMLEFVQVRVKHEKLTLDMRCRLLMVILIGNLDLAIDEHTSGESSDGRSQSNTSQFPSQQTDEHRASPWEHMEELLYRIRLYDDDTPSRNLSPRQEARDDQEEMSQLQERSPKMEKHIGETKTKLRTMLLCQYSFGSTVGAPVLYVPSCPCHNIYQHTILI
jgi:hypothetical protein